MFLEILFYTLSFIVVVASLLPLTRKDHWTFTVCEFPRLQKLFLVTVAILIGIFLFNRSWVIQIVLLVLAINAIYLLYLILPFSPLARKTVPTAKKGEKSALKLMVANVYQPNKKYHLLIKHMKRVQPDAILLVEADQKWMEGLKEFTDDYPYKIEYPKDNTYGILFYSKHEIINPEVRHIIHKEHPSIKLSLKLPGKQLCDFYGLHPPPPSPTERTYSTARDSELVKVAEEMDKLNDTPSIVAGDLNDVAWSYTTERFIKISGLRDPRKGRGIFATFHAKYFFMRWPLDHIFCSKHFRLIKMKRLGKIGSDHFPVLVELALDGGLRQR